VNEVMAASTVGKADRAWVAWHLALLIRDDCAAEAADLSCLWWDDGYEVYGYGDSVLRDGFGALVERLAAGLDIRFGQNVSQIAHDSNSGVQVRTRAGAEFEADAAVVTLPLGVLKFGSIDFAPQLPERKLSAIGRLGVGLLNKVVVHFDRAFWPPRQYAFGCSAAAVDTTPTCIINLCKTHAIPALVFIVGGGLARQVEEWSDRELRTWTLGVLEDTFGELPLEPRSITRTRWRTDPFARGSYSYVALGATPDDLNALAEPVDGRLFFAGEATVRQHWATVHSAYVSGLREAARISGQTDILPPRHFTENRRWREMMQRANRFFNMRGRALSGDELAQRLDVLRLNSLFEIVPPTDLEVLATMFDIRAYAEDDLVCRFGEHATEMYLILEGEAEVELPGASDARTLSRGDSFGEYGMFGSGVRSATVRARGPMVALVLDYQRFERFLLAFPESMAALLSTTVQRLIAREGRPTARSTSKRMPS
jgi:hypothetical protein